MKLYRKLIADIEREIYPDLCAKEHTHLIAIRIKRGIYTYETAPTGTNSKEFRETLKKLKLELNELIEYYEKTTNITSSN